MWLLADGWSSDRLAKRRSVSMSTCQPFQSCTKELSSLAGKTTRREVCGEWFCGWNAARRYFAKCWRNVVALWLCRRGVDDLCFYKSQVEYKHSCNLKHRGSSRFDWGTARARSSEVPHGAAFSGVWQRCIMSICISFRCSWEQILYHCVDRTTCLTLVCVCLYW